MANGKPREKMGKLKPRQLNQKDGLSRLLFVVFYFSVLSFLMSKKPHLLPCLVLGIVAKIP